MLNKLDLDNSPYYKVTDKNPIYIKLQELKGSKSLFHYTNETSAESILKSQTFWVTNSNYLDDKSELKYISFVLEYIIKYMTSISKEYIRGFYGEIIYEYILKSLNALKKQYKQEIPIEGNSVYILSLSERNNCKYLFDNYCSKEGKILEINNKTIRMLRENRYLYSAFTAKVVYDDGEQLQLIIKDINELYDELYYTLLKENSINYDKLAQTVRDVLFLKVMNYSFFFKDRKFIKENEYRIVFIVDKGNEKYRSINGRIIPYIEVSFEKDSVLLYNYCNTKFF